ncbi:hypothetical protein BCV69DRAFT_301499 [Microstroma glucosiphilum]|uniref:DUF1275 domain protein n=1 Tax=Pseudomicrostroma glucosiphilum TaxID=1684307 RepID=A0A316TY93_9BASI|nr:hypothetical protein BCV69DRAFT_301499 [Pseudomicrostroma glucosiphilum]PWN18040.1 hypothetical protein BCV69DRAFT_301499 [Pseudomicrostroma glucosiphilum]
MPRDERTPLLGGNGSHEPPSSRSKRTLTSRLDEHLDPSSCALPLALQCFVSGLVDCISFTSSKTWVAFMTGGLTQLAISGMAWFRFVVRDWLTEPSPGSWEQDQKSAKHRDEASNRIVLSVTTVVFFSLGGYLASHIKAPFTVQSSTRGRYVLLSFLQSLATTIVILLLVFSNTRLSLEKDPILLGLLSLAMGSQAIQALSLGSKAYSTTVVFTSTLAQLVGAAVFPAFLFPVSLTSPHHSRIASSEDEKARRTSISQSRHQCLSIVLLMAGAAVGSILIELQSATLPTGEGGSDNTEGGSSNSLQFWPLVVLALVQAITGLCWWFAAAQKREEEEEED